MRCERRALVLMYHRVGAVADKAEARYCIRPEHFAKQMTALAAHGYRAVPIEAFIAWLDGGPPLRDREFVLTFDDGYKGVLDHAAPVLERLHWPYTVFLVTELIGGCDAWPRNDGSAEAQHELLSADEIRSMARRGVSFHSHTCRHRSLPSLSADDLQAELAAARTALDRLVGGREHCIAYPYGHVDDRVVAAARSAGYTAGFSVQPGFNRSGIDRFRIRRLDVAGTDSPAMLLRKMRLGSNDGSRLAALRYATRRVGNRLGLRTA